MEFAFTLRFQLNSGDDDSETLVERLGDGGCTDALVGMGHPDRLALEFCRDAANARIALRSALTDVQRAIPSARLIEAAPDFVGLTDVAELVGVSRQNMRKLMLVNAGSFPAPVHEGTTSIWHLADLLSWLRTRGGYSIDQNLEQVAEANLELNLALGMQRVPVNAREGLLSFSGTPTDQFLTSKSSAS